MELFGLFLFLVFVGASFVEANFEDAETIMRANKAFIAILTQLTTLGIALSLILANAVATGDVLPWAAFVFGVVAMICKYLDLNTNLDRTDELGGEPLL